MDRICLSGMTNWLEKKWSRAAFNSAMRFFLALAYALKMTGRHHFTLSSVEAERGFSSNALTRRGTFGCSSFIPSRRP